jgi:hypothetical protein
MHDISFQTATTGASPAPSPSPAQKTRRPSPTRSLSHSSVGGGSRAKRTATTAAAPPPMRAGSISTLKLHTMSAPPSTSATPQHKPLYAWEMNSDLDDDSTLGGGHGTVLYPSVLRDRIYTAEYGSFVPSSQRGLYLQENDGGGDHDSYSDPHRTSRPQHTHPSRSHSPTSPTPQTHLDLQIIFSTAEFDAFLLRKSQLTKGKTISQNLAAKHAARYRDGQCKESKYLRNQTPYVDPKRILKEIYRPSNKEKWIDDKGFQLTNNKVLDE